jgi:hypothetical protein
MIREPQRQLRRPYIQFSGGYRALNVKQAILARVLSVERKSPVSVLVRLQSDSLEDAVEIVSTGLDLEQSTKLTGSFPEVICQGDPKARAGENVPVIVTLAASASA